MNKNGTLYPAFRITYGLLRVALRKIFRVPVLDTALSTISHPEYKNSFCGYYDHSPFQLGNEDVILLMSTNHPIYRKPSPSVSLVVSLYNWKKKEVILEIGKSYAWNWQQGCRAMWIDNNKCIYNTYNKQKNRYESVIFDVDSLKETRISIPVQELSAKNILYAINYSVLSKIRPDYGYFNITPRLIDFKSGIKSAGLFDSKPHCAISIIKIKNDTEKCVGGEIYDFKFNHVLASPSGDYIIYMFRYFFNEKRVTDIYIYDDDNRKILSDCNASHYCWLNDTSFIYTGIYNKIFGYNIYDINNNNVEQLLAYTDGHPCKIKKDLVLTDTYPNKFGIRSLIIFDLTNKKMISVSQSIEPFYIYGTQRCDLHPSITQSGSLWQIDVIKNHRRYVSIGKL